MLMRQFGNDRLHYLSIDQGVKLHNEPTLYECYSKPLNDTMHDHRRASWTAIAVVIMQNFTGTIPAILGSF